MINQFRLRRNILLPVLIGFLLLFGATSNFAQSLDPGSPTPIHSTNLLGKIAARDLGDSRITDHYYMFKGTPGDLLITVQSRNLNGDLDVFTAVTLRPLLKLSLYAENTKPVTKAIYLRKPEDLILRVEARSPNDDEGTYQLFFGGSFEAIAGGAELAEAESPATAPAATASGGRKTKRVTSAGARIDEPEPPVTEVAAAPTPEPTPEAKTPEPEPAVKEKPSESAKAPSTRNTRNRRPAGRRTTTSAPVTSPESPASTEEKKETAETEEVKPEEPATNPETESKPRTTGRSAPKRGSTTSTARNTPKPPPEPEPEFGPRLIIETNDGTLINRSMSTVRRVTVENGLVVVTGKDGKVERVVLANVVRMTIAP